MKNVRSLLRGLAVAAALGAGAAWGGSPDLVISSISVKEGTTVYPGDKIDITSVTKNIGTASTGWWYYGDVYYYFGTRTNDLSNKIGEGWTPNANEPNGISVDEEEEDTLTSWTVPANTAPGTYYIICKADATGKCTESNENNNLKALKITVRGIPSFTNVRWQGDLLQVSDGDTAVAYGECVNIPAGSWVTVKIMEDDPMGDDEIGTWSVKTQQGSNCVYFAKTWAAKWEDDASGDPEYYFTCTYTAYGKTATGNSGETEGTYLHVTQAEARMTPSPDLDAFYYDNDSGEGSSFTGASSGTVALTDDRIPIILVHGMSGDAKPKTLNYWYGWMNADPSGTLGYFNQSPMSSMFRVYRYVYDSRDHIGTNAAKFATFVTNFCAQHPEFAERQVVIMAHSMGGLVSRYAMNTNPDFAAKVHRLVTLGSPHQGSQGANPTWIKYSGPDDDSWFISGIYNTFKLHNNTAGCFDLAWYNLDQIPAEALTESAINEMTNTYHPDLLRASLTNPFCGLYGMRYETANDYKMVMFGGSSTNRITDYLSKDWPDEPSGEVKTDHLGLWVATKIFRSMSYRDGTGVGDNDGLVPLNSALLTDFNVHPDTAKINLNPEGQEVDHASYLDAPVTMDSVKTRLLTQVRTYCRTSDGTDLPAARWRIVEPNDALGAWQKGGVRLPALAPGVTYTVQFKAVDGYNTPASVKVTAKSGVTKVLTGTYTTTQASNHAPTGLALSNATVDDGAPAGTLVGTFSATDPDSGQSFTYSLVSGEGDTGNAWFTISGNRLLTAKVFDYEEYPAHYCRVQVADSAGATHEEAFVIQINNLPDTDGEATGDGWFNLNWDAVPNATAYRVNVAACGGSTTHVLPSATLGTNEFLNGQEWKYILPDGASAPSATEGAVSNAPIFTTYTADNITGHFLVGTNGIGIQTAPIYLDGADSVTLSFTNGAWNGKQVAARVTLTASYRIDGGTWTTLGTSVPANLGDGGPTNFSMALPSSSGSTVEFKIEALGACTSNNYLRGGYVTAASVALSGADVGNYANGCRVVGFPKTTTETSMRVDGLPVGEPYWHRVEAFVDGRWVAVSSGNSVTVDETLLPPENLDATIVESDAFLLEWDPVTGADGYVVQITDVVGQGTPGVISACPNVRLSGTANDSGWSYAANHVPNLSSNWFNPDATNAAAEYHILVVAPYPGVQSPTLDLSGYEEASVSFVMRKRGGQSVGTVWLWWSGDDGATWHQGDTATTNSIYINNNNRLTIDLPPEALVANARIELCANNADGTKTASGNGVGIRNLTLSGTPRGQPDYEAASVIEDIATEESFIAVDLTPKTHYWFRVQAVDDAWNVSDWADGETITAEANSAPSNLELSSASILENLPAGTEIGLLTATDPDENDEISFSIVEGEGDDDNDYFAIGGANGDRLLSAVAFDYEMKTNRTVRIRASDKRGAFVEAAFEIAILDEPGEAVTLVPASEIGSSVPMEDLLADFADGNPNRVEFVWDDDGAGAWDIYMSTNLLEGFFHHKRVYEAEWEYDLDDSPARFWIIQPVEH